MTSLGCLQKNSGLQWHLCTTEQLQDTYIARIVAMPAGRRSKCTSDDILPDAAIPCALGLHRVTVWVLCAGDMGAPRHLSAAIQPPASATQCCKVSRSAITPVCSALLIIIIMYKGGDQKQQALRLFNKSLHACGFGPLQCKLAHHCGILVQCQVEGV